MSNPRTSSARQHSGSGPRAVASRNIRSSTGAASIEAALAFSADGRMLGLSAVPRTIGLPPEERGWQLWVVPLSGGPAVPTAAVDAGCRPARHKPRVDARFAAHRSGSHLARDVRVTSVDGGSRARPGVVVDAVGPATSHIPRLRLMAGRWRFRRAIRLRRRRSFQRWHSTAVWRRPKRVRSRVVGGSQRCWRTSLTAAGETKSG